MNWTTAEQALGHLRSGMRVFLGSGCAAPQKLVEALGKRGREVFDVEIIHILTFGAAPYARRELLANFRHNAFFIGPNVRDAVNERVADYTPIFLSENPNEIEGRFFKTYLFQQPANGFPQVFEPALAFFDRASKEVR